MPYSCSPLTVAPTCCPEGWCLVFAGSRFTTPTKSCYAPTEGEALTVSWGLNNANVFVLGCMGLIAITNHKPLLNIFNHRDLSTITNPQLFKLKEKTLQYCFTIQYCPGKWHWAADAVSQHPTQSTIASIFTTTNIATNPTPANFNDAAIIEGTLNAICAISLADINNVISSDLSSCITYEELVNKCQTDDQYKILAFIVETGFPKMWHQTPPSVWEYCEVKEHLTVAGNIVLLNNLIVIPKKFRKEIFKTYILLIKAHPPCKLEQTKVSIGQAFITTLK